MICDSCGFFKPGERVVVLEDSSLPFCAKESAYSPEKQWWDYDHNEYDPLSDEELEVIEE